MSRSTAFRVHELPAFVIGKNATLCKIEGYKALARLHPHGINTPQTISVVRDTYTVIQTMDLQERVERALRNTYGDDIMGTMKIRSECCYNGARTIDQYILPALKESVGRSHVEMKITLENSYDGSSSVRIITGGDYAYCSNGMLIGDYDLITKMHKGKLIDGAIEEYIKNAIPAFASEAFKWRLWTERDINVLQANDLVKASPFSETQQAKIISLYLGQEREQHGPNLWALYNAGTAFATHASTRGNNDNNSTPLIRLERSRFVRKWTMTKEWREVANDKAA